MGGGGDTDIIFRIIVEQVNANGANPQLQVINIPGRSVNKGSAQFLRAKKDGCELLATHQSLITNYLGGQATMSWDAYQPVALLTKTPNYISVNANQPYNTIEELRAYAKENPETVLAAGSLGSISHYVLLMLEDALDVKFRHVSYDGTRERLTALLSGDAHIGLIDLSGSKKNIENGDIKLIAVTTVDRQDQMPDIPSISEEGYNVSFAVLRGISLPKGTDEKIVLYYENLFKEALENPALKNALYEKGTKPKFLNHKDYAKSFETETNSWIRFVKKIPVTWLVPLFINDEMN